MSAAPTRKLVHPVERLMLAGECDTTEKLRAATGLSEKALRSLIAGNTTPRLGTVKAIANAFDDVDAVELLEQIREWQEARA